jgi:REP element-mobilizing transposase RayT
MSRPLRIEYPEAWYHVMNRGRRRENIFEDDGDYRLFLEVLKDTAKMWNLKVSAYCLMSNHYHLLVQTPDGNLSRCMRHLNGVYTQRYNRKHGLDGQLFRGRYKSVLVEEDHYLLELLRYIHRNPVAAGMVEGLADYDWSSHQGYLSGKQGWNWLHRDPLIKMFSSNRRKACVEYLAFVEQQDSEEIQHLFSLKKLPSIFGSSGFIEKIRERFDFLVQNKELSNLQVLSVDEHSVIAAVCAVCHVERDQLFKMQRGVANVPRDLTIYVLRVHSSKTLNEIGSILNIIHYSTVNTAISRVQSSLKQESVVQEMYGKVCQQLKVGQPKI